MGVKQNSKKKAHTWKRKVGRTTNLGLDSQKNGMARREGAGNYGKEIGTYGHNSLLSIEVRGKMQKGQGVQPKPEKKQRSQKGTMPIRATDLLVSRGGGGGRDIRLRLRERGGACCLNLGKTVGSRKPVGQSLEEGRDHNSSSPSRGDELSQVFPDRNGRTSTVV